MNELLCRGSGLVKATPRHCTEATHPQLSRVAPSKIHFRVRRLTSAAHALVAAPLQDYALSRSLCGVGMADLLVPWDPPTLVLA
jgi:hypothetical protein